MLAERPGDPTCNCGSKLSYDRPVCRRIGSDRPEFRDPCCVHGAGSPLLPPVRSIAGAAASTAQARRSALCTFPLAADEHERQGLDLALYLLWSGALGDLETAVYFSPVSFTTLGFGDIVLDRPHRLLSGMLAANGLVLFGLTAALLIGLIRSLHPAQSETAPGD